MARWHFLAIVCLSCHPALAADPPASRPAAADLAGHRFLVTSVRTGDTEVFDVDPVTGDARNVTRSPASEDRYPCWSPDGKRIAFTSDRPQGSANGGTYNLFVCDADGSNVRQLTHETFPAVAYMPSWVGDRIAFGLHREKPEMATIREDGSDLKVLGEGHDPCLSPDGKRIAYTGHAAGGVSVFVMNADGSGKRQVVKDVNPWGAIFPSWSPDGRQVAYSFKVGEGLELFLVDADGAAPPRQLTTLGKVCTPAAWSPDGKWISFRYTDEMYWRNKARMAEVYANKPGEKRPVWVIRPDGTDAHAVEVLRYQNAMDGSRAAWKPPAAGAAGTGAMNPAAPNAGGPAVDGRPAAADTRYLELRVYHVTPGKLDAVLERFRDAVAPLYARHGVRALGYWTAADKENHPIFAYLVSAADKPAFDAAFKAFAADPAFRAAYAASQQKHGKTVERIDTIPLRATDWSPAFGAAAGAGGAGTPAAPPRAYELRVYEVAPGRMAGYLANYRDHRRRLFAKHGFESLGYWTGADDRHADTFVMLLGHREAGLIEPSKRAYHADPEWRQAVDDWTKSAGGPVTAGVTSYVMAPTDFSPAR